MKWDYVRCKGNYQSNFLNSTWLIDFIIYYFLFYNATVLAQSTLKYFTTIYYWNNKKKLKKKHFPRSKMFFLSFSPHFSSFPTPLTSHRRQSAARWSEESLDRTYRAHAQAEQVQSPFYYFLCIQWILLLILIFMIFIILTIFMISLFFVESSFNILHHTYR